MARRLARRIIPPLVVLGLVIGLWYAGSYALLSPEKRWLLPPPHAVVKVGYLDRANLTELAQGLRLTAEVALVGFLLAVLIGLIWAVLMSQAGWVERSLYPYAVVLQTTPILALVPMIAYLFGYGFSSRVAVCVLIALFPIIANTLYGLRSVDRAQHELFTLHGAGRLTRLWKLELPSALPSIVTGLRIAAGAALIGAIVGDFFFQQGQPGIGQLINIYPKRLQSEMLYAAAILASLFGIVVFWLFSGVGRLATGWHESAMDRPTPL